MDHEARIMKQMSKRFQGSLLIHAPGSVKPLWGFTVVELLVVIAIIAVLFAAGTLLYSSTKTKSRDTTREQHIKTLQSSLQLYVANHQAYPVYSGPITGQDEVSVALKDDSALADVPLDPLNRAEYRYVYDSASGESYTITYYLESSSIPGKPAGQNVVSP